MTLEKANFSDDSEIVQNPTGSSAKKRGRIAA